MPMAPAASPAAFNRPGAAATAPADLAAAAPVAVTVTAASEVATPVKARSDRTILTSAFWTLVAYDLRSLAMFAGNAEKYAGTVTAGGAVAKESKSIEADVPPGAAAAAALEALAMEES